MRDPVPTVGRIGLTLGDFLLQQIRPRQEGEAEVYFIRCVKLEHAVGFPVSGRIGIRSAVASLKPAQRLS
jgi:hypothetical protein